MVAQYRLSLELRPLLYWIYRSLPDSPALTFIPSLLLPLFCSLDITSSSRISFGNDATSSTPIDMASERNSSTPLFFCPSCDFSSVVSACCFLRSFMRSSSSKHSSLRSSDTFMYLSNTSLYLSSTALTMSCGTLSSPPYFLNTLSLSSI